MKIHKKACFGQTDDKNVETLKNIIKYLNDNDNNNNKIKARSIVLCCQKYTVF
jgi:hypothetical protein